MNGVLLHFHNFPCRMNFMQPLGLSEKVMEIAGEQNAIPFDVPDVELGSDGNCRRTKCNSF